MSLRSRRIHVEQHYVTRVGWLRAAVLGANDGLLSNLSLVMGVAGANLANREIVITGIAGLLAGAGSMALGEWLSVANAPCNYCDKVTQ